MPYIDVPIDTDAVDLAETAYEYIEGKVDGWLPSPANLESWIIEANALWASELRALIALVPDSIFEYFGETVMALPAFAATQAIGQTTWTMTDAGGYTVAAGALVTITPPAAVDTYAYAVLNSFTVPAGQTHAYNVQVQAVEAGSAQSGITGTVDVLDALDFVASVTLDAPTSGGADAETSESYRNRLSDLLTLLTPRPILPQDFAVLTQRTFPQVARATAIDLYNPGPPIDAAAPRCVTVVPVDANGLALSANDKAAIDTFLQSVREVNFLVFVVDPTYTAIAVDFAATSYPGYDPVDVKARAIANVTAYLSAKNWGLPPYGDTSTRSWINDNTVRRLELSQVINNTEGVHYITTLQLAPSGSGFGTADVVMPGVAPLPTPGTITGAITAES